LLLLLLLLLLMLLLLLLLLHMVTVIDQPFDFRLAVLGRAVFGRQTVDDNPLGSDDHLAAVRRMMRRDVFLHISVNDRFVLRVSSDGQKNKQTAFIIGPRAKRANYT